MMVEDGSESDERTDASEGSKGLVAGANGAGSDHPFPVLPPSILAHVTVPDSQSMSLTSGIDGRERTTASRSDVSRSHEASELAEANRIEGQSVIG
jgi:hypothetical protein